MSHSINKKEALSEGDILTEREPDNKYDSNAVKILNTEGEIVVVPKNLILQWRNWKFLQYIL